MTTVHKSKDAPEARCSECDHDLIVKPERDQGKVYCSNSSCRHATQPHLTPNHPNQGRTTAV